MGDDWGYPLEMAYLSLIYPEKTWWCSIVFCIHVDQRVSQQNRRRHCHCASAWGCQQCLPPRSSREMCASQCSPEARQGVWGNRRVWLVEKRFPSGDWANWLHTPCIFNQITNTRRMSELLQVVDYHINYPQNAMPCEPFGGFQLVIGVTGYRVRT